MKNPSPSFPSEDTAEAARPRSEATLGWEDVFLPLLWDLVNGRAVSGTPPLWSPARQLSVNHVGMRWACQYLWAHRYGTRQQQRTARENVTHWFVHQEEIGHMALERGGRVGCEQFSTAYGWMHRFIAASIGLEGRALGHRPIARLADRWWAHHVEAQRPCFTPRGTVEIPGCRMTFLGDRSRDVCLQWLLEGRPRRRLTRRWYENRGHWDAELVRRSIMAGEPLGASASPERPKLYNPFSVSRDEAGHRAWAPRMDGNVGWAVWAVRVDYGTGAVDRVRARGAGEIPERPGWIPEI
ncbi:MAG TPA: hypothetical protein VE685_24475 [Thermoanaerobaculia bacterium]|nr:hypothetical protein [Thermoanaerobaculia bacterium]